MTRLTRLTRLTRHDAMCRFDRRCMHAYQDRVVPSRKMPRSHVIIYASTRILSTVDGIVTELEEPRMSNIFEASSSPSCPAGDSSPLNHFLTKEIHPLSTMLECFLPLYTAILTSICNQGAVSSSQLLVFRHGRREQKAAIDAPVKERRALIQAGRYLQTS